MKDSISTSSSKAGDRLCWGLLQRRARWGLSARGWLLVLVFVLAVAACFVFVVHPFLSVTDRVDSEFLVVEGWVSDHQMELAVVEFKAHPYRKLFSTGVPLGKGAFLSEYKTFAEVGAQTLMKLGLDSNHVVAVPGQYTRRGRTIESATALRSWFEEHGMEPKSINIVTSGTHSRRTRLLYERVFGASVKVGVIAVESRDYDPKRWWLYSAGVRAVISDLIGYGNSRLLGR